MSILDAPTFYAGTRESFEHLRASPQLELELELELELKL
jgi:hypothetical protein